MTEHIRLVIDSENYIDLVYESFDKVCSRLGHTDSHNLKEAMGEVIENIRLYAYDDPRHFWLEVLFSSDKYHIRIDIQDRGIPFNFELYRSESIEKTADHTKGFYRIYDLVDRFYFSNLPGCGKRFSLINGLQNVQESPFFSPKPIAIDRSALQEEISIRLFKPSDAEGITRLVYRNYDHTYYKTIYYDAPAIQKANAERTIISVVAEYKGALIGHFALIPSAVSSIAEIGAAVVDPVYKGFGVMNQMFDYLIETAKQLRFHALYGEAIMIHPYSQKANHRHGMKESAILLGEVPSSIEIEHHLKDTMRSGAAIAFLLFDPHPRNLFIPERYADRIRLTYDQNKILFAVSTHFSSEPIHPAIHYRVNPQLNVGFIIIDAITSQDALDTVIDTILAHHCDMIYVDLNLETLSEIAILIEWLNKRRFFYGGVLFSFYHDQDYLRLQRKNALDIDEEQLVCYSEDAKELLSFILDDERRINQ